MDEFIHDVVGTDRRLRHVCIDGGYLGQTGPDMLNARLSQDDPEGDIVRQWRWCPSYPRYRHAAAKRFDIVDNLLAG
jgi:hypothetical protein